MQYDERICTECGAEYAPKHAGQKTCGPECARRRHKRRAKERARAAAQAQTLKKPKNEPTPPTDWKSITRICAEHHLTYGEAVRKGLL